VSESEYEKFIKERKSAALAPARSLKTLKYNRANASEPPALQK
jgi:hypothetical protein